MSRFDPEKVIVQIGKRSVGRGMVDPATFIELYEAAEQGDKLLEQARDFIAAIVCEPEHMAEANDLIARIEAALAAYRKETEG